MTETFVVGVDGSEESLDAVRWATGLGRTCGATVRAVLVWSLLAQPHADGEPFDPAYREDDALADLDRILDKAVGDGKAAIERAAPCDLPVEGLLDAARDADLLVVGARGLGGFKGLLLGSVSRKLLERSPVPVAVVRGAVPAAGRRIVVGVDGSPEADTALAWAAHLARRTGQPLAVVHAWMVPWPAETAASAEAVDAVRDEAQRMLDAAVASVGDRLEVEPVLAAGGAARSLIEEAARDTALVVVGTRGRGGALAALLGSVSHQLAHHTAVPLVVVPSEP